MPRPSNNERQNDMPSDMENDQITSRAASERDERNRDDRVRDEEGRFAGGRQTRSRAADDDTHAGSGRGRGWFGDPQGHAQAGSRSHDNTRAGTRTRGYDDEDRYAGRRHAGEGQFTGSRHADDEEAEFGAWHAYGHNRGWHGYQRNASADPSQRNRDSEGRFSSGRGADYDDVRNFAGRDQDDYRNARTRDYDEEDYRRAAPRGGNRPRDEEGRFASQNRH